MSAIINVAGQRLNAVRAGVTGLVEANPTVNVPTAPLVERILVPQQYGGISNLFSDLIPMHNPPITGPPIEIGPNGGALNPGAGGKQYVVTVLGPTYTRIRQALGL